MAIKERKCLGCATSYKYCPDCSRVDKLAPSWKAQFCSEGCMTLWMTLTRYNMSKLTKSEAKEIISSLDLKPIDSYVQCVKRDYEKVMTEENKPKRGKRSAVNVIDDAMDLPKEIVESIVKELVEIKVEQPITVAEPVVENSTEHEVVLKENE